MDINYIATKGAQLSAKKQNLAEIIKSVKKIKVLPQGNRYVPTVTIHLPDSYSSCGHNVDLFKDSSKTLFTTQMSERYAILFLNAIKEVQQTIIDEIYEAIEVEENELKQYILDSTSSEFDSKSEYLLTIKKVK
jgi:hypothetical protein